MKLYPPIYPGDSLLQPGSLPGCDADEQGHEARSKASFVRSSIVAGRELETGIDLAAIEEQARAARSAWVASQLKSVYSTLARKFEHIAQERLERELTATNRVCHS